MIPTILLNHLGYAVAAPKRAIVMHTEGVAAVAFRILRADGSPAYESRMQQPQRVDNWRDWQFQVLDFGDLRESGSFRAEVGETISAPFDVQESLLVDRTAEAIVAYYTSQRCKSPYDDADRKAPFFGSRTDRIDVHGGWYDASGDVSKYLSHLSYANFMNPQQTPVVVYNLLWAKALFESRPGYDTLCERLLSEAAHGGDFLVRMLDAAGYFYMTVFDRWTKKVEERQICSYKTQQGIKLESYQCGYRQGGGVAIAALARLAASGHAGELSGDAYLQAAKKAFAHLQEHNLEYLDDGRENIIDDYCALLAASELFAATGEARYRQAASVRAEQLIQRQTSDARFRDFWSANERRPYFHAAEAGFPVVALLRWAELVETSSERERVFDVVRRALDFETAITDEVDNPFGYARQYVKPANGDNRSSFFFPHDNESGYWWQGENARLASLAAAAGLALAKGCISPARQARVLRYAHDQLDWILGRNPFDSCMLHGFGRNNLDYLPAWPNAVGGICNGITSGYYDESDIDFGRVVPEGDHSWRWAEQWIPHAAWYLLAIAALAR